MIAKIQTACARLSLTLCLLTSLACLKLEAQEQGEGLYALMNSIAQAQGGRVALYRIDTIMMTGTYRRDDRAWDFNLIQRKPDFARFTANQSQGDYVLLHDGKDVWERLPFEDRYVTLGRTAAARFLRHVYVVSPLWQLFESNARLNYLGTALVDNTRCHLIEYEAPQMGRLRFAVDEGRSLIIRVDHALPGEEQFSETIRYGRYRTEAGLRLPHLITVYRGEWEYEVFDIEQYAINPGIYTTVFQPD